MGIWKTIKETFGTSTPPDARRLSAVDELALSASIKALPIGERGWITLSEARALFSPMDDQYAFGEMDDAQTQSERQRHETSPQNFSASRSGCCRCPSRLR